MKSVRKKCITERDFYLLHDLRRDNPNLTYENLGMLIGITGSCASKALKRKTWEEYEKFKADNREKAKKKKQRQEDIDQDIDPLKPKPLKVEPLKIITADQMNRDAATREAINQLNQIGIAFHKLAEFLYNNFTLDSRKEG